MLRRIVVAVAFVVAGCTRDVDLPPAPPVLASGVVTGRVVMSTPGRTDKVPVKGVVVSLQGSTNTVATDAEGRFSLDGIQTSTGALLFRLDLDHDGTVDHQKILSLESIGAAPGRAVSAGDVVLSENARLHGRVRLADHQGSPGGHFGTLVFIPQSPFSTFTSDDGSFVLDQLPEGTANLAAFHDGYDVGGVSNLVLQGGADLGLSDVILTVRTSTPTPGRITGTVHLVPSADLSGTSLTATPATGGAAGSGTAAADGTFTLSGLAPGVYDVTAAHAGYTPALVGNVAVLPGQETAVDITIGQGVAASAITRTVSDAGPEVDSGVLDAGVPDAGLGLVCRTQADCPYFLQCLNGTCQPLCQSVGCGPGQVCDPPTGVCETPCGDGGTCGSGQVCDAKGYCRPGCDLAIPSSCAAGLHCSNGACVPECTPDGGQCGAHQSCQGFVCKANGTCDLDSDCSYATLCIAGSCVPRPTAVVDAGAGVAPRFACAAPCDCKMGEVCKLDAGVCLPEDFPTRFLTSDGGVGPAFGLLPSRATSSLATAVFDGGVRVVIAMKDQDVVTTTTAATLGGDYSAIRGGYVECGTNRWVRSEVGRSTLSGPSLSYTYVLRIVGDATRTSTGITLANFDVISGGNTGLQNDALIEATNATRLHASGLRGQVSLNGFTTYVLYLITSDNVLVEDVGVLPQVPASAHKSYAVGTLGGSGTFRGLYAAPGLQSGAGFITTSQNIGPIVIEGIDAGSMVAVNNQNVVMFDIGGCLAPVTVRNNHVQFPIYSTPTGTTGQLQVLAANGCQALTVTGNDFDGRSVIGPYMASDTNATVIGAWLTASAGVFKGNRISLPTMSNGSGSTQGPFIGVRIEGGSTGVGSFDFSNNVIEAANLSEGFRGLVIKDVTAPGALSIRNLVVDAGITSYSSQMVYAVQLDNTTGAAGVSITDSDLHPPAIASNGGCGNASVGLGLDLRAAVLRVERTRIMVPASEYSVGVLARYGAQLELYSSYVSTGGGTCTSSWTGNMPEAAFINDSAGGSTQTWLEGNTIEVNNLISGSSPVAALFCQGAGSYVPVLGASSNIFGAGQGSSHRMVATAGVVPCLLPANFSNNYFWTARAGRDTADAVGLITASDGGIPDARGNIVGESVSPYAPSGPLCTLANPGPAIGKGDAGVRRDGTAVTLDLNGKTIAAPVDIGACQH